MKLCTILSFSLIMSLNASVLKSYSQGTRVTINLNDVTVREVMDKIEKSSKYIFIYYDNIIDLNRKISLEEKNQSIENILDKMFESTNNTYTIIDRQIVISLKNQPVNNEDVSLENKENQQQIPVTGVVTDQKGLPLAGVSVTVKGTTIGGNTDAAGNYSLPNVPQNATLVFSFIGMTAQEVPLNGQTRIDIVMKEETVGLEEVVVVGYGVQKKESMVGAISQINNATLMNAGTSRLTNAITGKLSGVLTIQENGEPGVNQSRIIVRGVSSWNGSNPLVLVDGVERDFSRLDPNEINTISVLKDASATAVFGAKGANGVVIVTTKRGILGKPKVDMSAAYGMEIPTRTPDFIDSYTTMKLLNVARMNGQQFTELVPDRILEEYRHPSTRLNALRYPNVDWFDELVKPFSPTANANLSVAGGTEFVKYFLSLGYQYEGSIFKGTEGGSIDNRYYNHQFNYRINVDFKLSKTTQLSLNVGGELDIKNQPANNPWRNLYSTGPSRYPAYFPAWVLEEVPDTYYPDASGDRLATSFGEYTGNPYTNLVQPGFSRDLGSRLFTDLILDQKLDVVLKGLSVRGKVSLSTYYSNRSLTLNYSLPEYQLYYDRIGVDANNDGIIDQNPWVRKGEGNENFFLPPPDVNVGGLNGGYYDDLYYEMSLNYANTFGRNSITGLFLFNRQQKNSGLDFPYYNEGLVGRATYDYDHKYLLELNMGYTGSERFAPDNRFGFFPSAAFGWVISEEQFFKNAVPWMNRLKIRYSDGLVGSDYASSRWLYTSAFTKDANGNIREDLGPNKAAQWERARKRDIGFEIGLFQNLFTINVDLFDEYRDKMLLTPKSVTVLVGNSFKDLNLGKVKKHGFEVEAEFRKTTAGNFQYFVRGLFGFNENRIIFKDDPLYTPEYLKSAGKPLTGMLSTITNTAYPAGIDGLELNGVSLTGSGYYTSVDDIHNNVAPIDVTKLYVGDYKFLDFTSDGTITNLDKYPIKGLTYPPVIYSFGSGFSYKNFDFNFLFQGNAGKYVKFTQTFEKEFYMGNYRIHKSQLDYWSPVNPDANHSTLHYSGATSAEILFWGGGEEVDGYWIVIEDRYFRKADYLKLKDVYIAYTFNSAYLNRLIGVSKLLVYATGNNLLTFTKLIEGDPEKTIIPFGKGINQYPFMGGVKLGVKIVF